MTKSETMHGADVVNRPHIHVEFQHGIPSEVGENGCRVEDVIDVLVDQLEFYQSGPLSCTENEQALRGLRIAKRALFERIVRRREQGVFNTMEQHISMRTEDEHDDFSATGA